MKIIVVHEIPDDPAHCSDGDSGGWRTVCKYLKYRNRTGKWGNPIRCREPRCALFERWLAKDFVYIAKCEDCLRAMQAGEGKRDDG